MTVLALYSAAGATPRQAAVASFVGLTDRLPAPRFWALRNAIYELLGQMSTDEALVALAALLDEISEALERPESDEREVTGTRVTP